MLVPKILRSLPPSPTPTHAWKRKAARASEAVVLSLIPAVSPQGTKVEVTVHQASASMWDRKTGLRLEVGWDPDVAVKGSLGFYRLKSATRRTPLKIALIDDLRTPGGQLAFVNEVREVCDLAPLAELPAGTHWQTESEGHLTTGHHTVIRRSSLALAA